MICVCVHFVFLLLLECCRGLESEDDISKREERLGPECFSKQVGLLLLGGDPDRFDQMLMNPFAQTVVADVDVFSALVMTFFGGHRDGRSVIDVQWRRVRLGEPEIREDLTVPNDLVTSLRCSDILRFGGAV